MQLKSITSAKNIKNSRVLVRLDLDLPLANNRVVDDSRLQAALPTLNYLLAKQAQLILAGHLGRPAGKPQASFSLSPVANRLAQLLKKKIKLIPLERYVGPAALASSKDMQAGQIIMLENLRFSEREEKNCKKFARRLAALADIYVNDAFGASHRAHASISAIHKYLPSFLGFNPLQEIKHLTQALTKPAHPLIVIIGGAKIATKLPLIKHYARSADHLLLGGGVANTFIKSLGYQVGRSLVDNQYLATAKKLFINTHRSNILLPPDVKTNLAAKRVDLVKSNELILDIGPETIKLYGSLAKSAKTIIWNGPMGKFEDPKFAQGSTALAADILKSQAAILIGGGDTHQLFKGKKIPANIFISSGGGAMLAFLSKSPMPGLNR